METEKIPIPSKRSSNINQIIKQMRWKAFFDMKGSGDNTQKTYGLKSLNSHQKSKKMVPFEKDSWNLANKLKFRQIKSNFKTRLNKYIRVI